jgi:prepilin-type N-terminal cleavage/methylation domain-containing protein
MRRKKMLGLTQKRVIAFTLVELLTVIAIIAILAALVLGAGSGVMQKAARSRAAGEIQGMSTALEGYKADNGIYPVGNTAGAANSVLGGAPYSQLDPTATGGPYQTSSEALYQALSSQTNYATAPVAGIKSYMTFKTSQIGNITAGQSSYIKDPWGNSYGYASGDSGDTNNAPFNGAGFFDLWSTGNTTADKPPNYATNAWISNWQ